MAIEGLQNTHMPARVIGRRIGLADASILRNVSMRSTGKHTGRITSPAAQIDR